MSNWISVKDRLPVNSADEMKGDVHMVVDVTVYDGDNVYGSYFQAGSTGEFWGVFEYEGVTHWQELPEPPIKQQG